VYVALIVIRLRVLTWNLMHGRVQPDAGCDQREVFTAALADWEWDVALLQEVPAWWPASLAESLAAEYRLVLTSRNALVPLRRAVARRWSHLIPSGGGANVILARRDRIVGDRSMRLSGFPQRRWMHGAWLACGVWIVNLHSSTDELRAQRDGDLAAAESLRWAAGGPLVVGGDFNLRHPRPDGLRQVGARDVDHIFVGARMEPVGAAEIVQRGSPSDRPPLVATVQPIG
jgi:endonuclease/exonuclease/phosphatase family metal-dependent hydrolase